MRPVRPFAFLAILLVAGCAAPAPEDPPEDPAPPAEGLPFPDPLLAPEGHDHRDAAAHAFAWNFEETSHHPLAGSASHSSGAHALDVRGTWLFAAVYGGEADGEGGFFVFDVSDPATPKEVGRYRFPGALGGDRSMEATDDGDFVLLGTELLNCAGHVNPVAPGLYLVDVRQKDRPVPVHHVPSAGVHSVTVHRIGDADYVFAMMGGQNVFRLVREPVPRLEAVAELSIGHDSIVVDDPLLGKPLLYAANGAAGFVVWDVSDPASPKVLGEWNIPDRPQDKYYVHTGAVTFVEGRRIAVVTSEDWEDYPSALWVLDATDPAEIELLANWSAPGAHPADGLRFSMHNPRFLGTTLILAYYHGGVWALDLSKNETLSSPRVVGQFMPGKSNGWVPEKPKTSAVADRMCGVFNLADTPLAFDVEAGDGVVYVADLHTGLYTIRPLW